MSSAQNFGAPDPAARVSRILRYNGSTGDFLSEFVPDDSGGLDVPIGLAFGPHDEHLYVSSSQNNEILRYNGGTGAFLDVFVTNNDPACPVSGLLDRPWGLVFGPDGHLYVSNAVQGEPANFVARVSRYHRDTGCLLGSFSIESRSRLLGLTFGPDNHLYVSQGGFDAITRYDGMTGAFLNDLGTRNRPEGVVFGPDGHLYVSGGPSDTICGTTERPALSSCLCPRGSWGPAASHRPDPWSRWASLRQQCGQQPDPALPWYHRRVPGRVRGCRQRRARLAPGHTSFAMMRSTSAVRAAIRSCASMVPPARSWACSWLPAAAGSPRPRAYSFADDALYVSSAGSNQILRFHGTSGAFLGVFVDAVSFPDGLAFGPDGHLYVSSYVSSVNNSSVIDQAILRFDGTTGAALEPFVRFGSSSLFEPIGLVFSPF